MAKPRQKTIQKTNGGNNRNHALRDFYCHELQKKRNGTGKAVQKQYKDTVFRMLFRDPERLLELYNAVSGRHYTDSGELQVVTLENAIYMGVKNDLAFLIDLRLYLYEHQSTVNPNMPFRFLQYVTEEYNRLTAEENLYGSSLVKLPTPHFVVFYNGTDSQPERQVLRLSAAYQVPEEEPQMELQALVLNINEGFNAQLKEQCGTLKEYMRYVDRVREYARDMPMEEAVDRAVDECIEEGILREFLLANKAEVKRMSIFEYDDEATKRAIRREEYERGREEGKAEAVLELLEEIGTVSESMRNSILHQTDMDILKKWHKSAARANSLEEWKEKVEWRE